MASVARMRRWERWGLGRAAVLKGPLASLAVSRLAAELYRDRSSWAASALVRAAASSVQPAASKAFDALVEACGDPGAAGDVIHQCLLQCTAREGETDSRWTQLAAPLLLGGSPPRLVQFLDRAPVGDHPWIRPEGIVDQLMMHLSFNSPHRPDLERFLSTTNQPLIVDKLVALWADDTFLPNRVVTDVSIANPHVVPPDSGSNILLAVAKDRLDLLDFTRAGTIDSLLRGTGLASAEVADKYRRVLRRLPPGVARERLCEVVISGVIGAGEAAAAAIEAGYLPEQQRDRVVFLYLSEQWGRYDEVDPDGELIYAAYLELNRSTDLRTHSLRWRILGTARRNGRPDPAVRYLAENPVPETRKSDRPRGTVSGPSSDYGSGGHHGGWIGGVHT